MLTDHPTPAAPVASATSRTSRSRGLPLAGLTLAATLALAACSGDAEEPADDGGTGATDAAPAEESTEPTEESPSADDTANSPDNSESSDGSDSGGEYVPASADGPAQNVPEPEMPDEVSRESDAGVEAAIEYFFESDWYLAESGNPAPLIEISHPDCELCESEASYFTKLYDRGSWYVSDKSEIQTLDVEITDESHATAWATVDSSSIAQYASDGAEDGTSPATYGNQWKFQLVFRDGHWTMRTATYADGTGSESPSTEE